MMCPMCRAHATLVTKAARSFDDRDSYDGAELYGLVDDDESCSIA
jgi:hypothetical protein